MKFSVRSIFLTAAFVAVLLFPVLVASAHADPHCERCPYTCADLGLGKKDCSQLSESRGLCCLDLTSKGLKLALAQKNALDAAPEVQDSCPPGFRPSEQKCTNDERRHGCKDVRTPRGLGCKNR
jgi:hypothetical protein